MHTLIVKWKPAALQLVCEPTGQEQAANDNRLSGEELVACIMSNYPDLTREDIELLLLAADRL